MPKIWSECPKCGDNMLQAEYLDTLDSIGYRHVMCSKCGFEWQEVYELSRIEDMDGMFLNYKGEIIEL